MIILAAAIILSLNNSGIINRAEEAVDRTNLAQVKQLASVKWAEAYTDGKRDPAEIESYILAELAEDGTLKVARSMSKLNSYSCTSTLCYGVQCNVVSVSLVN